MQGDVDQGNVDGMVYAIHIDNHLVRAAAPGMSEIGTDRPMQPDGLSDIASMT